MRNNGAIDLVRRAVLTGDYDGMTSADIAKALGLPTKTTYRALLRLQDTKLTNAAGLVLKQGAMDDSGGAVPSSTWVFTALVLLTVYLRSGTQLPYCDFHHNGQQAVQDGVRYECDAPTGQWLKLKDE